MLGVNVLANNNNYAQQARDAKLNKMPRLAFEALDVYVAGARSLAELGETASGVLQVGCGVMAAGHAIYGITRLLCRADSQDHSEKLRYSAMAVGEFISAAGFVGLTAGMGVWALPLLGIGLATTNFAQYA
ncbi:MAG: hypothetical protein FJX76_06460 [Armatimonadetes bacterium]|nr:hypothetical protein [Armatimonadota bacterium]